MLILAPTVPTQPHSPTLNKNPVYPHRVFAIPPVREEIESHYALDVRRERRHNIRVSLILQSNTKRGKIRIRSDAEGRQILLADIEEAIREEDHAFGVLGVQLDEPAGAGGDWQTVEFYNIVCVADEKAPLRVDNSVSISGGRKALTTLRNKLMDLTEEHMCLELKITDVYPTPRKRNRLPWLAGVACCAPFLYLAGKCLFIFNSNGDDMAGLQFWFYLATALALLPMPWLISLRSGLSVRLNAGFGMAALVPLLILILGVFKNTAPYVNLPEPLFHAFLPLAAALTLLAAAVPYMLWRKNPTEEKEKRTLKWVDVLLLRPLGGAALFALLVLGSVLYAIRFCYNGAEHWYDYFLYIPFFAAFTPPVAVLAGLLNPGIWQRIAYRLLCCTLLPGLVLAAPCYYLGTPIIGIHDTLPRLLLAAIPLVLAVILIFPLKKGMVRRGNEPD